MAGARLVVTVVFLRSGSHILRHGLVDTFSLSLEQGLKWEEKFASHHLLSTSSFLTFLNVLILTKHNSL